MLNAPLARTLGPCAALFAYLGGVSEAHASYHRAGIADLVMTSTYSTLHSCVVSFSEIATGSGSSGSAGCGGSWMFDLLTLGLLCTTVVVIMRMRHRAEGNRLELARQFIEQGIEPPDSLFPSAARADLRRGVILIFAGLGLLATDYGESSLGPVGLIPGFIGLGYLISYVLSQRLVVRSNKAKQ